MTGPEHYKEAERLLARAKDPRALVGQREADRHSAQAHATLALAAAQVETIAARGPGDVSHEWSRAVFKAGTE